MAERVKPWADGEPRCHCTHCPCCGFLFRTIELDQHLVEAHLGGYDQEQKHLREAARLLALIDYFETAMGCGQEQVDQYEVDAAAWLRAEQNRQKEVRGG